MDSFLANSAMNFSQAEAVQALLDAKASRGVGAQDDTNALHFAAMQGQVEVCKLLLAAGGRLSVRSRDAAACPVATVSNSICNNSYEDTHICRN